MPGALFKLRLGGDFGSDLSILLRTENWELLLRNKDHC
jgi:hypothetical protein